MEKDGNKKLQDTIAGNFAAISQRLEGFQPQLRFEEIGTVSYVGNGIARIKGLSHVKSEELIRFPGEKFAIAFNLDPEEVAVVMLDKGVEIKAGQEVHRTEGHGCARG